MDQQLPPFRRIARAIAEQIARGELAPGDLVPSEREIMERWGVAKATANKVLAALKADGLVDTVVGAGARAPRSSPYVVRATPR